MTSWAFCTNCSWTTTAGSIDVAGDGERHAGMRGHVVRVGGEVPQEADIADLAATGIGMAAGGHP